MKMQSTWEFLVVCRLLLLPRVFFWRQVPDMPRNKHNSVVRGGTLNRTLAKRRTRKRLIAGLPTRRTTPNAVRTNVKPSRGAARRPVTSSTETNRLLGMVEEHVTPA